MTLPYLRDPGPGTARYRWMTPVGWTSVVLLGATVDIVVVNDPNGEQPPISAAWLVAERTLIGTQGR